jgi:hypothetical protein
MPDNPEYFCSDERACQQNRARRFPDRDTEELKLARQQVAYWEHAQDAAVLALTAFHSARHGIRDQGTLLALTRPQKPLQPRPGG